MMKGAPRNRKSWWRNRWFAMSRALRGALLLEDTPYRIAMGSACGLFASVLPLFGQMVVGMVLARVLRGNVFASMPWTWLSNPLTTLPIWYGCYRVGAWLMPGDQSLVSFARISAIVGDFQELGLRESFASGYAMLADIVMPLVIGTVAMGAVLGVGGYFLLHRLVRRLQARRAARTAHWRDKVFRPVDPGAGS